MYYFPTIVALATPPGTAALHIIRLSGEDSYEILNKITLNYVERESMTAELNYIIGANKSIIDQVILVKFVEPSSYTGEDLIEINCHGNMLIVQLIIEQLVKNGAKLAAPGDYTKRAFLANKIDLNQAAAVLNLIHAKTQRGVQSAITNLRGDISKKIKYFQEKIFELMAECEINIDYPDELGGGESRLASKIYLRVGRILTAMATLLDNSTNQKLRNWRVVLIGRANAGKSSLLNNILNYERVIVSDVPGTTRDSVEVDYYLKGSIITFVDTAGIHETDNKIEKAGIERTINEIQNADLILHVIAGDEPDHPEDVKIKKLYKETYSSPNSLQIYSKADLVTERKKRKIYFSNLNQDLTPVLKAIEKNMATLQIDSTAVFGLASSNGIENLHLAFMELQKIKGDLSIDLIAEHLTIANHHLLRVLGMNDDFDLINSIFANFCVGK